MSGSPLFACPSHFGGRATTTRRKTGVIMVRPPPKWDEGRLLRVGAVDGVRRGRADAGTLASVPLPVRPVLKPALRQVWRDAVTLQLGLAPQRAVVLAALTPPDSHLFGLLDGSRDVATAFNDASALGCPPERAVRLIELLAAADALDDGPPADPRLEPDLLSLALLHPGPGAAARVLARRRAASVAVYGAGRVGAAVATLLAAAGVGKLAGVDEGPLRPADPGPPGLPEQGAGTPATAGGAPPPAARAPRRGWPGGAWESSRSSTKAPYVLLPGDPPASANRAQAHAQRRWSHHCGVRALR